MKLLKDFHYNQRKRSYRLFMKYCMIEIAFDNLDEVNQVCQKLLEEKLVGSCQII